MILYVYKVNMIDIKSIGSLILYLESQQQCEYGEYFYCKNGETTLCSFRCDGDNDCGDNSDEEPYVCPTNKKIISNAKSNRVRVQTLVYI